MDRLIARKKCGGNKFDWLLAVMTSSLISTVTSKQWERGPIVTLDERHKIFPEINFYSM